MQYLTEQDLMARCGLGQGVELHLSLEERLTPVSYTHLFLKKGFPSLPPNPHPSSSQDFHVYRIPVHDIPC